MKRLAEEFEKKITCLGENTQICIKVLKEQQIQQEVTTIDKNGEEITKNVSYIFKYIDCTRFMVSSSSNLSIIFPKEFIKLNVNTDTMIKNVRLVELNINRRIS